MSQYEVIIVLDPALTEDGVEAAIGGVREVVGKKGGEVLEVQKWGKKRLAYEVKKRREGQYVLMKVDGAGEIVADLDRHFRITEVILKGVVVRAEEPRRGRFKVKSQAATLEGSAVTTTQEMGDGEL
ncbi:MAG: 30S ribosomal protein S6 [candidate division NC10 bacterium]|nr:30S ribosomal protein S6 [candidate division NC10 bacterium]MDE2320958.1 30S ribosomal protein S6 [candidate division NC10 bacterium]